MPWVNVFGADRLYLPEHGTPGYVASRLNGLLADRSGLDIPVFEHSNQTFSALDYEAEVARGYIPTRDCLHDWYNGLVWLMFPLTRRAINQIHLKEASDGNSGNGRSARRNALTLFDESGALLITLNDDFADALWAHDWQTVFIERRTVWETDAKLVLFGHGLLEALHNPYKGLCAKVLRLSLSSSDCSKDLSGLDAVLCERVGVLENSRELTPLPVMGLPGWNDQNEHVDFYSDRSVFRPKPTR